MSYRSTQNITQNQHTHKLKPSLVVSYSINIKPGNEVGLFS